MTTQSSDAEHNNDFLLLVGDRPVDLTQYTVKVHGREVIDYEKLNADDPALYKEILADEFEANRREAEELEEILSRPTIELTPELLKSLQSVVVPEKPATSKYFYLPLFLSIPNEVQSDEHKADILTFSDNLGQAMSYASRVLPGQTLAEAVENDLRTDFAYDGDFQIKNHHFQDMAADKKGNQLPRLVVIIKVDHFSPDTLYPAGLRVQWSPDVATRLSAYRFEL